MASLFGLRTHLHVIAYLGLWLQEPFSQLKDPLSFVLYVALIVLHRYPF